MAYRRLGERCGFDAPSVAVRSSTLDEDGAAASFARRHETYLNIVGVEAGKLRKGDILVAEATPTVDAAIRDGRGGRHRHGGYPEPLRGGGAGVPNASRGRHGAGDDDDSRWSDPGCGR